MRSRHRDPLDARRQLVLHTTSSTISNMASLSQAATGAVGSQWEHVLLSDWKLGFTISCCPSKNNKQLGGSSHMSCEIRQ